MLSSAYHRSARPLQRRTPLGLQWLGLMGLAVTFWGMPRAYATEVNTVLVIVNSIQDGPITPDTALTLREAIALVNGTLSPQALSAAEATLVTPAQQPRIEFNLPSVNTTIQLKTLLPALNIPNLTINGTSQPGFTPSTKGNPWQMQPTVTITPAPGQVLSRGLTVTADRTTIRGLSLYGFASQTRQAESTPTADIVITHVEGPIAAPWQQNSQDHAFAQNSERPPTDVVIEQNWLGSAPGESTDQPSKRTSGFGIFVFNALNLTIRQNHIAYHNGSAIITGKRATSLKIHQNRIAENGRSGMLDAIRLEGEIDQTVVTENLIEKNGGSAISLFKPTGTVVIQKNRLFQNGQQARQAAVRLMGSNHRVLDNQIQGQSGPGVLVAAYPRSQGNQILGNHFADLAGLSIDLITRQNTEPTVYEAGDGPNPLRDSSNRQLDTANEAINTPLFLSHEFYMHNNRVNLDGKADPGSQIILYRVPPGDTAIGPLSEPIAETTANEAGRFGFTLTDAQVGDRFSAISHDPDHGTSEPAVNVEVKSLN
jgi:hypothetical protein